MINKTSIIFSALLLLVFIVRVYLLINSPLTFFSDDAIYATLAQAWGERDWQYIFHPAWPPLFPALSALVYLLIPNFETALRTVSILAGTMIIIPLFFLMGKSASPWIKAIFVLIVTFSSPILDASMLPLSDMLFTALIISGITTFFVVIKEAYINNNQFDWKKVCLGSTFLGLAYLTRSESLIFLILTLFYFTVLMLTSFIRDKKISLEPILIIFLLLITFSLIISPYVVATRLQLGFWTLSQKFSSQIQQGDMFALNKNNSTWLQEVASVKSPNYHSFYFKNGNAYILEHLDNFIKKFGRKLISWQTIFLDLFPKWSILFIIVGIFSVIRKKTFLAFSYIIFLMFTIIPITVFSTVVAEPRYLLWALPFFIYLFFAGLETLYWLVKKIFNFHSNILSDAIIFLLILLPITFQLSSLNDITHPSLYFNNFTVLHNKTELRDAGFWIKNHTIKPNPKIMMSHEAVAFYAGGETIYTPQINYPNLLAYAKKNRVDYFVAWTPELGINKDLSFLTDQNNLHPGLTKLYNIQKKDSDLIIYSLNNEL